MLGTHELVSGHVNASLRSRVSSFKNLQVLGEWSVVPTNKCSSEMKAALLPSSYVEKVGQCTWGKNLLLLCSHPSNPDLIVSMNTFKLVAVLVLCFRCHLQICHGLSHWRKCFYHGPLDCSAPPPDSTKQWPLKSCAQSTSVHCISPPICSSNIPH